jgi:mannose-6-phosphate isomerase-like protein (cupin superfamily)
MNRAEFEADARREGFDIHEGEIKPDVHRESHVHNWDARLFVLDGHLTLVRGNGRETFGPGDSCSLSANTPHEEHTEADGVRYLAARRPAAAQASAAD